MNCTKTIIAGLAAILLLTSCRHDNTYTCTCTIIPGPNMPRGHIATKRDIQAKDLTEAANKCNSLDTEGVDCNL